MPKTQSRLAGFLNDGAVGHRVAERNAQLDDVCTGFDHAMHERGRDIGLRKTSHDIRNECFAFFSTKFF